jgi:hypothetical protein
VVLRQLATAAAALALGQGVEGVEVAHDGGGLPERPDEVLALREVHPRLAADGGVDHPQQCRRHVHDGDPPVVHRGREPGDVGDHTAADGHDAVGPGEAPAAPRRA